MITYKQIIKKYSQELKEITHIPQKEVEILLLFILEKNIIWLHLNYDKECLVEKRLKSLVQKRATNYPLEYIIQKASFYGETFITKDGVLIPRPQTEILVEKAIKILENIDSPKVIEVGVGSGIISVMLALLIKDITIVAVDINSQALELAKKNAIKFKVEDKIIFVSSDIFDEIEVENFNMCISNPPYIQDSYSLPLNVKYEPKNALFGGVVGDELLKKIIDQSYEKKIQYLLCEMGYDQKEPLNQYLQNYKTKSVKFYKDYEKFDRGFIVEFNYEK